MDGGGAAAGGASGRRSCGRPQHSLARCPRTSSLFCSSSAARSAALRSPNVTNAQCRASRICAHRWAASAPADFAIFQHDKRENTSPHSKHFMTPEALAANNHCSTSTWMQHQILLISNAARRNSTLVKQHRMQRRRGAPVWSGSRQRGRTGRAGRPLPRPPPGRPHTCNDLPA